MAEEREFDVIIFGATGYTGQYVIEELAISTKDRDFKWAVAGRSKEKLQQTLDDVQFGIDVSIEKTTVIVADVNDAESISNMVKRAKLILNCVGPYKLYGEVVVSACVEHGTHHIDISGEIQYLETTQANYFEAAREKGVYIVQACGFDSIPADFGISLLKKEFKGDLNSVESYVEFGVGSEGRTTNFGTFYSAMLSVKDSLVPGKYGKLLKEKVFKQEMPENSHPMAHRLPLFFSEIMKSWCLWFPGPDEHVIARSQMFRNEFLNERPIQAYAYIKMHSLLYALSYILFAGIFGFLSMFSLGRYLLTSFPSFFSAGAFSKSGPTKTQVMQGSTKVTLCGEGWAEKLPEHTDRHVEEPNKKMTLKISGPEPAYALTSICMVHAGLVVLDEQDKMPLTGGVLTPGVAFENTTLRKHLEERLVSFHFDS